MNNAFEKIILIKQWIFQSIILFQYKIQLNQFRGDVY